MKAIRFRDFSDASQIVEIGAGMPLYQSIPGNQLRYVVNGREVTPDYVPGEGDVVIARTIPGDPATIAVIAGIAAIVAVGTATYAGVKAYQAKKQADELKDRMKGLNDSVQNLPFIRGASNSVATGKTQPYIVGEHLFTPYKLLQHFYKLSGTDGVDSYYIDVYQGGFNKQVIRELRIDDVLVKDFGSGTTPQEGAFAFDAGSPFYDADSLIEVSQDGAGFSTADFQKKIVSEQPGSELKKSDDPAYEDLIFTLSEYSRSADVCILFNGLRTYTDKGEHTARTVIVTPYYSLNSGANWTAFSFNQNGTPSNSFSRDTMNQLRFNAHVDFTYSSVSGLTAPVLIKLVCSTARAVNSAYDQVYVQWVQSAVFDPDASAAAGAFVDEKILDTVEAALSVQVGLRVKATSSNQEKLTKVNMVTSGVARTWSGSAWSLSKVPTRNLAAWILEVLTSPTHAASQLDDTELDLASFGEFYSYCATNGINVDLVMMDGDEKQAWLSALCDIGNCALYQNIYGEISVAWDGPRANAVAVFNTQNLLSFDVEKEFSRRTDGIRVSYVSRDGGYAEDSYLVMRDGVTRNSESIIRDVNLTGVTEYAQVVKYARRLMAIEALRPNVVHVRTGKEGTYYTPFSKAYVQHPALGNGLGSAEIQSTIEEAGYIIGVRLYEPVQYDSSVVSGFGVIIMAVGTDYVTQIARAYTATSNGLVSEIYFTVPIAVGAAAIPHAGDVLSYGYLNGGAFDTITTPMIIVDISPEGVGFALSLTNYDEDIFDPGTIPTYTPNLTIRKSQLSTEPQPPDPNQDKTLQAISNITYFETRYIRSASAPETPTVADPAGWTTYVPIGSDAIWMSGAQKTAAGTLVGAWYTPVRFTNAATIVGVLTNEYHAVPTDEDGNNGNYTGAESELRIYEGAVDTTSLWTFGATASVGVTGTLVGNRYTVTNLATDSEYIDLVASRSGMSSITKRFKLTRARQGDPVPAYNLRVSTSVIKTYTDGSKSPDSVTFSAYSSIGLAEPTPYAGIFKLFVNDVLQFQSSTPQTSFTWYNFADVPTETDFPTEFDFPLFTVEGALSDVEIMRIELWSSDNALKVDSQSIAFFKDVGFQLTDIINAALDQVPDRTPKYLGRFQAAPPSVYRWGDWFTIYDSDDAPYQRGVYIVNRNLAVTRIAGDEGAESKYMMDALPDVLWAVQHGYGVTSDYGSITFIANLAVNTIFATALSANEAFIGDLRNNMIETKEVILKTGGVIRSQNYVAGVSGMRMDSAGNTEFNNGKFRGIISAGKANLDEIILSNITAGDNIIKKDDAEIYRSYTTSYIKIKEKQICASGTARVYFELRPAVDWNWVRGRIYKNGSAYGIEHTIFTNPYSSVIEDIPIVAGDIIELWVRAESSGYYGYVRNFRISISQNPGILPFLGSV